MPSFTMTEALTLRGHDDKRYLRIVRFKAQRHHRSHDSVCESEDDDRGLKEDSGGELRPRLDYYAVLARAAFV